MQLYNIRVENSPPATLRYWISLNGIYWKYTPIDQQQIATKYGLKQARDLVSFLRNSWFLVSIVPVLEQVNE